MPSSSPTIAQLERALEIAQQIQKLEEEMTAVMGGDGFGSSEPVSSSISSTPAKRGPGRPPKSSASPATTPSKSGRKPFSAEARAKMAASQKARWAAKRGDESVTASVSSTPSKKVRRTMSPEVKARLAAAMKARWAAAKKKGLPAPNARK